ncbi:MAG: hypothetical protein ACREAA_04970 [Candidatus Polarisedimenticolia bacterium]
MNRLAQTEVRPGMAYSLMIRGPLEAMTARVLEKLATEYIRSGSAEPKILNRRLPYALIARFQVREDLQSRLEMSLFLDGLAIGGKGDSVLADIRSNVAYAVERMLEKKLPDMEKILSYDRRALCLYAVDVLAESDVVRAVLPVDMLAHSSLDAVVLIDCENHVEAVFDPHRLLPERRAPRGEE